MASSQVPLLLLLWSLLMISIISPLHACKCKPPSLKKTLNVIDKCWRRNPKWAANRRALADCAIGFGKYAIGGKYGKIYVVTDPSDHPTKPKPGTLRYAVIQKEPLWIIFAKDMIIRLKNELIMNSFKTIDGRGTKVAIGNGPCITIQFVRHVIIHGIRFSKCKTGKPGLVISNIEYTSYRGGSDGDAIHIFGSSNIWIDHCHLTHAHDGLIDIIHGSTAITISNNYLKQQDTVMLFGHDDHYIQDKSMKVTVAFNHFGPGLVERMPRVRFGYAHVANNRYHKWEMYAIGGSAGATIFSEGNYFMASNNRFTKQVTKRMASNGWENWKWISSRDRFLNGAYFVESGYGSAKPGYKKYESFPVADGSKVPALTADAGPIRCSTKTACL